MPGNPCGRHSRRRQTIRRRTSTWAPGGGEKRCEGAERYLKAALKYDPQMAQAAYNLCILLSKDRLEGAVRYCRKASELRPDDPKYAYTLAFFLHRKGETAEAVRTLKAITEKHPDIRMRVASRGHHEKQGGQTMRNKRTATGASIGIVICLMMALCLPALAQIDPLPSWNNGPAKQAIIGFVRAAADKANPEYVAPEARIAVFDQDGTTWVEMPVYPQAISHSTRSA